MPARIVAARRNKGLSRRQAAPVIGVSYDTLAKAEKGLSISEDSRKKIADFVGCDATDIWPVPTDREAA